MNCVNVASLEAAPRPAEAERVLFVFDGEFALDNGVSNYIRTIGDYAAKEGCDVEYLVGKTEIDEPNVSAFSSSVAVHANGSRSYVPIYTPTERVVGLLNRVNPDAVHVQMPFLPSLSGKVINHLSPGTNLVGTFHTPLPGGWLRAANKLNAHLTRNEMRRFDHFFSISEAAQKAAQEIYGVESEILPCPVDLDRASDRYNSDTSNSHTIITFLGRIVARKGLATLLSSVELLEPEVQDGLQIKIIGEGEDRATIEQQVADIGLSDKTEFFGKVDEKKKYELLASSDIIAYPSMGAESFGIVLVEAMASGKPVVIASNIDGYAEVLSGAPDALVTKNDPQALADRIKSLIDNPDRKHALFNEQQLIVRRFDVKRTIGPRLLQAYGFQEAGQL